MIFHHYGISSIANSSLLYFNNRFFMIIDQIFIIFDGSRCLINWFSLTILLAEQLMRFLQNHLYHRLHREVGDALTFENIYIYIHVYIYICVCVCIYIYMYIYIYICLYIYIHIYIYKNICIYICTRLRMFTCRHGVRKLLCSRAAHCITTTQCNNTVQQHPPKAQCNNACRGVARKLLLWTAQGNTATQRNNTV